MAADFQSGGGSLSDRKVFYRHGSQYDEYRDLLFRRVRILFLLAAGISTILIAVSRLMDHPGNPYMRSSQELTLDAAHVLSFVLGLVLLYVLRDDARRMQWMAFGTLAFNALIGSVSTGGLFVPDYPPELVAALLLFVPAAVIPWRTPFQLALACVTAVAFLFSALAIYTLDPASHETFATLDAFILRFAMFATGVSTLAATSVFMTHTLYTLRKRAADARRLGSYVIDREIAAGGMGRVYLARHSLMWRPAAVKVLRESELVGDDALARFEQEVRLSATLSHPNTITIFDFGRADTGSFYYAMEFLEGLDLQRLIRRFGPIEPERAIHFLTQICGSLTEAHARRIVHRDLKPANVFVTEKGGIHDFVKVLDFGIAKQLEVDPQGPVTRTGVVVGTPSYMAPESITGETEIDARVDIYGLGGIGYFMLTGRSPFESESPVRALADHVLTEPLPVSKLMETPVPAELELVLMRCLAKAPEDRFATAKQLRAALSAVPLENPWSAERACAWWELHALAAEGPAIGRSVDELEAPGDPVLEAES